MQIAFYDTRITEDYRTVLVKVNTVDYEMQRLNSVEDVVKMANDLVSLNVLGEEHCYMTALNNRGRVLGIFLLSKGTATSSLVGEREIFMRALLVGAVRIILIHNHPSTDCSPSKEDIMLTRKIREAEPLIGIHLDDHIIVGGDVYFSFKEHEMF